MIKTTWEEVCEIDNLKEAFDKEIKKISIKNQIKYINKKDSYCNRLQKEMLEFDFSFNNIKYKQIKEREKIRKISLIGFKEKMIQRAILQKIEATLYKRFIPTTYQAIKGRGLHKMSLAVRQALKNKKNIYCLKFDIVKYYENVDKTILYTKVKELIQCKKLRKAMAKIIFAGEGIPLGFLTSQVLGNFYLTKLDKKVVSFKRVFYFRYADDLLIISPYKKTINKIKAFVCKKLAILKLQYRIYEKKILRSSDSISYCGFKFYQDKVLFRNKTKERIKKKINLMKHYKKWCNSKELFKVYIS